MANVTNWIRIGVDSSAVNVGLKSAKRQLSLFAKQSQKDFNNASAGVNKFKKSISGLSIALKVVASAFAAVELVKFADGLNLVRSRINLFAEDQENLIEVQEMLRKSSKASYNQYEDTANIYARMSTALERFGLDQEQIVAMGQALNQSFRLAGATAQEVNAVSIQLVQGMGANKLAGDEFKSIQEGNVVLLKLMAKELGINVGMLKSYAQQSKITGEVIVNTLLKNYKYLNDEAAKLSVTTAQAMNNLKTEFGIVVELANDMTGATDKIADFIEMIGEGLTSQSSNIIDSLMFIQIAFQRFVTAIKISMENLIHFASMSPTEAIKAAIVGVGEIPGMIDDAVQEMPAIDFTFNDYDFAAGLYKQFAGAPDAMYDSIVSFGDTVSEATSEAFDEIMSTANPDIQDFANELGFGYDHLLIKTEKATKGVKEFNATLGKTPDSSAIDKIKFEPDVAKFSEEEKKVREEVVAARKEEIALNDTHLGRLKEIKDEEKKNLELIYEKANELQNQIRARKELESIDSNQAGIKIPLTAAEAFAKAIGTQIEKLKLIDPPMGRFVEHIRKMDLALKAGTLTNEEFAQGATMAGEKFLKLGEDAEDVVTEFDLYIEKMDLLNPKMSRFVQDIRELQIAMDEEKITLEEFTKRIGELNEEFNTNAKSMDDYFEELKNTIEGFSRDASQAFADFITKGKFDFADFADAIINDLIRMTAQKLIFDQAFAAFGGALGSVGNKSSGNTSIGTQGNLDAALLDNANGNAFSGGNVIPFARGGVVNKPTLFPMANGTGLMGEAGPEAVMPLKRGADGKLGVSGGATVVNINVENKTRDTQVEIEETDNPMGGKDIKIMMSNIEAHLSNRVATRRGPLFNTLQQGGFNGKLR